MIPYFLLWLLNSLILVNASMMIQNGKVSENITMEAQSLALTLTVRDIKLPHGFHRNSHRPHSFEAYLRNFKIKEGDMQVNLYDGSIKRNQSAHFCILDIDVGKRDLQQCADAVMRLRGEYLYGLGEYEKISFNFTNGDAVPFSKYAQGKRVYIENNKVRWKNSAEADSSYRSFRNYMDLIFSYAGTYSLSKELSKVENAKELKSGDVFIQGGFPGHAMIVMDVAINEKDGSKIFLLAQSYMPAQEMHIVVNPSRPEISPWYEISSNEDVITPEWSFSYADLMTWHEHAH